MDLPDAMLNKNPKKKLLGIIRNGNLGTLEKAFENLLAEYVVTTEPLEKQGLNENDLKDFILESSELIEQRQSDIFIELGAKILGYGG